MQPEQPQHVWCSSAARTVSTHGALGLDVPVAFSDGLYLGDERDWLGCIHAVPEEIQRILIIGHNPGMHALAAKLAHSAQNDTEMEQLREGFPTCALAILSSTPHGKKLLKIQVIWNISAVETTYPIRVVNASKDRINSAPRMRTCSLK